MSIKEGETFRLSNLGVVEEKDAFSNVIGAGTFGELLQTLRRWFHTGDARKRPLSGSGCHFSSGFYMNVFADDGCFSFLTEGRLCLSPQQRMGLEAGQGKSEQKTPLSHKRGTKISKGAIKGNRREWCFVLFF